MATKKRVIKAIVWILNLIAAVGIWGIGGWLMTENMGYTLHIGMLLIALAPFLIGVTIFLLWSLQKKLQYLWESGKNSKIDKMLKKFFISICILLAPYGLYLIPSWNLNPLVPLKISGMMLFCSLLIIFFFNFLVSLIPVEQDLEKPKCKVKRDNLADA